MSPLINYWQVQLAFRAYLSRRSSIILFIRAVSWLYMLFLFRSWSSRFGPSNRTQSRLSPFQTCFVLQLHDQEAEKKTASHLPF